MGRFKTELQLNKPDSFIDYITKDYLIKENFVQKQIEGGTVWQNGAGFLTAPQYIKVTYLNGILSIEAWLKYALLPGVYVGEMGLTGFFGALPKGSLRKKVEQIIALVSQPLPSDYQTSSDSANEIQTENQNANINNQPIPVYAHDTSSKATLALIFGLLSFLGLIIPLVGIVLGALGVVNGKKGMNSSKKGLATGGYILSIIGTVLSIAVWIINIVFVTSHIR